MYWYERDKKAFTSFFFQISTDEAWNSDLFSSILMCQGNIQFFFSPGFISRRNTYTYYFTNVFFNLQIFDESWNTHGYQDFSALGDCRHPIKIRGQLPICYPPGHAIEFVQPYCVWTVYFETTITYAYTTSVAWHGFILRSDSTAWKR